MRYLSHTISAFSAAFFILASCTGTVEESQDGSNNDGGNNSGDVAYEVIENSFDYGELQFYGVYYEDQPEDVHNWSLVLAEDSFNLIEWTGTGDAICIELFTASSFTQDIPEGKYTVEAFLNEQWAKMSVGDGIVETSDDTEYTVGTWLYTDGTGIAGATSGEVNISKEGNVYTITYDFKDDEYRIHFKGSYSGPLDFYDGTAEAEYAAVKSSAVRRMKKAGSVRFQK